MARWRPRQPPARAPGWYRDEDLAMSSIHQSGASRRERRTRRILRHHTQAVLAHFTIVRQSLFGSLHMSFVTKSTVLVGRLD